MTTVTDFYPKGVSVTREVLDQFTDYRGRKVRLVQTLSVEGHATTPPAVIDTWKKTIGTKYLERYCRRTRYDDARWMTLGKREMEEYPEVNLA